MIVICDKCKRKYNNDTVSQCPICKLKSEYAFVKVPELSKPEIIKVKKKRKKR